MTQPNPNLQRINNALSHLHRTPPEDHLPDATETPPVAPSPALSMPTLDPQTVRPFPPMTSAASVDLPHFPASTAPRSRQVSNPRLAMGILKELEKTVANWEQELNRVSLDIQDLQLEGPVIEGWLESQPASSDSQTDEFWQQADVKALADYVSGLDAPATSGAASAVSHQPALAGYRLCHLDADGQVHCQPCPADQVPLVSLAIARHQKLRQLLSRQADLESRLTRLAETLIAAHSQLDPDARVG